MTIKQQLIDATGALRRADWGPVFGTILCASIATSVAKVSMGSDLAKDAIRAAFLGGAVVLLGLKYLVSLAGWRQRLAAARRLRLGPLAHLAACQPKEIGRLALYLSRLARPPRRHACGPGLQAVPFMARSDSRAVLMVLAVCLVVEQPVHWVVTQHVLKGPQFAGLHLLMFSLSMMTLAVIALDLWHMKPAWHSLTATRLRLRLGARQVLNCRLADIAGCELLQQAPDTRSQAGRRQPAAAERAWRVTPFDKPNVRLTLHAPCWFPTLFDAVRVIDCRVDDPQAFIACLRQRMAPDMSPPPSS